MSADLIVIAAHGDEHVDDCVRSLAGQPTTVVWTDNYGPEPNGYSTGAYRWAYRTFRKHHDGFLFIQDSMRAKVPDVVTPFKERQPERGCVAWSRFPLSWDSKEQENWAHYMYPGDWPQVGIFGPIFYTNRSSLDELAERNLLPPIPMNKQQAQGTERLWALAFHAAGMEIASASDMAFNHQVMSTGGFPFFDKVFAGRQ